MCRWEICTYFYIKKLKLLSFYTFWANFNLHEITAWGLRIAIHNDRWIESSVVHGTSLRDIVILGQIFDTRDLKTSNYCLPSFDIQIIIPPGFPRRHNQPQQ